MLEKAPVLYDKQNLTPICKLLNEQPNILRLGKEWGENDKSSMNDQ